MPTAASSRASARAKRSASGSEPARPSVAIGGQRVNGSFRRATRPPSWSMLTQSGIARPSASTSAASSATCSGASTLRLKRIGAAEIELARQRPPLGRNRHARETADQRAVRSRARGERHRAASKIIMCAVRITASAPTRIDLAGGTIDIWPLYLFHHGAQTLNAAISLRAHVEITPRDDGDGRDRVGGHRAARRGRVGRATLRDDESAAAAGQAGVRVRRARPDACARAANRRPAPGIAGSSALNVAVCGALARWTGSDGRPRSSCWRRR